MNILGINCFEHDSAASLLSDGKIIAVVEEERFLRKKHIGDFPTESIGFCLKKGDLKLTDIDHIAFSYDYSNKIKKKIWKFQPYFSRNRMNLYRHAKLLRSFKKNELEIEKLGKKAGAKVHFMDHHMCHAASAFFGSEFNRANILSLDGQGEITTTLLAEGKGNEIEKIKEIALPNSIGHLYTTFTKFLGFTPWGGEGKTMGLAPYGKDRFGSTFRKIVKLDENGFTVDPKFMWHFSKWDSLFNRFKGPFGIPRKNQHPINGHFEDIAYSLQKRTEETALHLVDLLKDATGRKDLCLSGGVALNSAMNGKLLLSENVDNIYIQPSSNDAGTSLGGAYMLYNQITGKRPEATNHVYYGPEYNDDEIKDTLKKFKLKYDKTSDVAGEVSDALSKGDIVGWFQGKMEIGPRALGARSILANPAVENMKDKINKHVKRREEWRPFAPSVLSQKKDIYFEDACDSPFMILIFKVKKEVQKMIEGAVHVDETARVQTVHKETNPLYHKMISNFGKETDLWSVLNTSFNLRGEPIVNTPEEAIVDFYRSGMDKLAIGNYILEK